MNGSEEALRAGAKVKHTAPAMAQSGNRAVKAVRRAGRGRSCDARMPDEALRVRSVSRSVPA
jgi:hypothetical protein